MNLADLLEAIGSFFGQALSWMSTLIASIVGNAPLLIFTFGFFTVGFVVGLLRRVLRVG